MNPFNSSVDKPLQFYEHLLSEKGYKEYREQFFLIYENKLEDDAMAYEIHREKDFVKDFYASAILNSEYVYTLKDAIIKRSAKELEQSRKLISEKVSMLEFYNEPVGEYFDGLSVKIHELITGKKDLIKEIPELFSHLNSLISYINSLSGQTKEFLKKEPAKHSPEPEIDKDEELVHKIFGYLNGANEIGNKFMSDAEYKRMTSLILNMIKNKVVPEKGNEIRFNVKINVDVLRYTFYVLQLSFIGKKKYDYFYQFMYNTFNHFQKVKDIDTLGNMIAKLPYELPPYIPQIIIDQKNYQEQRREKEK